MDEVEDLLHVLAQFRKGLRQFSTFSERITAERGLTPALQQLMLVVVTSRTVPDIQMVANGLGLAHHSAAELVQRAEQAGLLTRHADPSDARRWLLKPTAEGREKVLSLALVHARELSRIRTSAFGGLERLDELLRQIDQRSPS